MRIKNWLHERFIAHEGIGHKAHAVAVSASGAAQTIDFDEGLAFDITLTANCTLTFDNEPDDSTVIEALFAFTQDGIGSRTVTWPANVTGAPALSTGAGSPGDSDYIRLTHLNGTWVAEQVAQVAA